MTTQEMCEKIKSKYDDDFSDAQRIRVIDEHDVVISNHNYGLPKMGIFQFLFNPCYRFAKKMWGEGSVCINCGKPESLGEETREGHLYCEAGYCPAHEYHAGELGKMCAREWSTKEILGYIAKRI